MKTKLRLPDGTSVAVDSKGYLTEPADWSPIVATNMAAADGISLTPDHWVVLRIVRDYFAEFGIEPPMRILVKRARETLGQDKGTSLHLYRLYPEGPVTQACRYAGLPCPVSCV